MEELNSKFFKFLWSDRGHMLKRNTIMINDYYEGVLGMIVLIFLNIPRKSWKVEISISLATTPIWGPDHF